MQHRLLLPLLALALCACNTYQPLRDDKILYPSPRRAPDGPGVKVMYFGNTTILISDGETTLLVDGFFSRPNPLSVKFGKIEPNEKVIQKQLDLAKMGRVDALLIGHSHYDHALDAPLVAQKLDAIAAQQGKHTVTMGSSSYAFIHEGGGATCDREHLHIVERDGMTRTFGKFTVTFRPSEHISPHLPGQADMMGHVQALVVPPAKAKDFKCDPVYVLHIRHADEGSIAITTTAGALKDQFKGLTADVVMPAVGLLSKEPCCQQEFYWREAVEKLNPKTVIPVHWDNFLLKLDDSPQVRRNLKAPPLKFFDDTRSTMDFVKRHSKDKDVWTMGLRDSFLLRSGKVLLAKQDM
ncbi:MAG: MBL fold metallo-hydrolase [Verrucomicrobiaceae bacterium]|nr:MBL fold metallo-hydrolase [Verrucomicrobiaceae bacterium]